LLIPVLGALNAFSHGKVELSELDRAQAQASGDRKIVAEIPFFLQRNRTILPLVVSEKETLDVILDTGMRFDGVYLFHKEVKELFAVDGLDSVRVGGAGSGEATYALMADSMSLTFGNVLFQNQLVVISQSETTQDFPTDGVAGYTFFGTYVVHIDHDQLLMRLYDPKEFTADTLWHEMPMTLKEKIPFVDGKVSVQGEDPIAVVLYIDSAAGEALELLVSETMKFSLPDNREEQYLGTGLSGDIYGSVGCIAGFWFGEHLLRDVPTAFAPAEVRSKQEGADGIIGNDLLRRFNVILDYSDSSLYIKPNDSFSTSFGACSSNDCEGRSP
jgi:hypothetical protein